jgi:hypothetical protein
MPDQLPNEAVEAWREEAWQCYVESGADPDGADARHLNLGEAVIAVQDLRRDYEAAGDEVVGLERQVAELEGMLLSPSHIDALDIAFDAGVKALNGHGNADFWAALGEARAKLRARAGERNPDG